MTTGEASETLEGILERITYANEENAWSVVRLAVPGRRHLVTAVGNLLGVQPGESLRMRGRWTTDRRYGEQFVVESYLQIQPATLTGIERYLGSGLVRGIGKVMAKRLVERFGLQTLDVIESQADRLTEVEGIGPIRRERIQSAWREQREIKEVMLFLQSNGVSTSHAIRIYKEYGDRAIAVVRENPYRLALDIFGIGFKTADRIAMNLGIPPNSPRRAEAGVLHMLGVFSDEGHVFAAEDLLVDATQKALDVDPEIIRAAIEDLSRSARVVVEASPEAGPRSVYLKSLHTAEAGAAALLASIAREPPKPIAIDVDRALAWFEGRHGITLAPGQREAVQRAVTEKVLVVTGGPGTGKTTLVNGVIQILERKGRRVLLAAPTGRAAKRMTEATGHDARTIHRLLEFSPKTMAFERNQGHPLEADVVIVDEFSMVDVVLAYNLLKAVPPRCQLVIVGDVDQLPSVGPGNVLKDLIESGIVSVVRLSTIFRQAERSRIVVNAHRVNGGEMPLTQDDAGADFFFIARKEPDEVLATIKNLVAERIPRRFGLDPLDDVQVLTPMHRGRLGASSLNAELQQLLNPSGETIVRGTRSFRVGDKVLQLRNNYQMEVWNGDIGRVTAIDPVEREMRVRFDDRIVTYDYADLDELTLAYACSIHKSQGSEYPCVVVPLHTQHYVMLQRNLLYTAITRGKRLVVLVGTKRALAIAVRNAEIGRRLTRLKDRLRALARA